MKHFATFVLIAAFAGACGGSVVHKRPKSEATNRAVTEMWSDEIKRVAQDGDWILTRSYSLVGDVITLTTAGESVSHSSMYDAERGMIIEAVRPAVRAVPLEDLLDRNRYAIVVRPSGTTAEERREALVRARGQVGTKFDLSGLVGLDNSARFYCSELVFWAAKMDQQHDKTLVITPAELMEMGEVVYFSGSRDDEQVQSAAYARRDLMRDRARTAAR
jgi:uncharacterized protein YycO